VVEKEEGGGRKGEGGGRERGEGRGGGREEGKEGGERRKGRGGGEGGGGGRGRGGGRKVSKDSAAQKSNLPDCVYCFVYYLHLLFFLDVEIVGKQIHSQPVYTAVGKLLLVCACLCQEVSRRWSVGNGHTPDMGRAYEQSLPTMHAKCMKKWAQLLQEGFMHEEIFVTK